MATRLLDTNIISFLIGRHSLANRYRPHIRGYTLAVSFMTVGELWEGALRARWGPGRIGRLTATLGGCIVYHSNDSICHSWANVRLQRRHQPIDSTDAWIAATALVHGLELVTHNPADFQGIPGLAIITEAP
jgi:predicted nucleic acid-binding protein